jgi:hypothetical protein
MTICVGTNDAPERLKDYRKALRAYGPCDHFSIMGAVLVGIIGYYFITNVASLRMIFAWD